MKIFKVINNNIVSVFDQEGNEIIYMGKGIGFKKHPGDTFVISDVEKKFILSSTEANNNQLVKLLNEIPLDITDIAIEIFEKASLKLNKPLNDSSIISLADHIYTAIERSKENIYVKNILLWDIKKFYPDEYKIGKLALEIIHEHTHVSLPDDEAGFIAFHLVNAQMENNVDDMYELTKIMQEILNIVKYTFKINFNEDSIYYYRFISHLKFFAKRLLTNKEYENSDDNLFNIVKMQYEESYKCVEKIAAFINNNYHYFLSDEEKLYLTIHIERIVKNLRN